MSRHGAGSSPFGIDFTKACGGVSPDRFELSTNGLKGRCSTG